MQPMANMFGDYRLLKRIATGGMGEVYLAMLEREGGFAKAVALKMILPTAAKKPGFLARFEEEAAVVAMLNHANIVQIFDHGIIEGRPYLTMEVVEGPDLNQLIEAYGNKPFPVEVVAEIGIQLCRALGHAHERKDLQGNSMCIIHRDVSPSNILLSMDGQAKLADFGLARVLQEAREEKWIEGKFSYMSPEQAAGGPLTVQSDLFSLGLVLYELFTGRRAYTVADSPSKTLHAIVQGEHLPAAETLPGLNPGIDSFLARALALGPGDRYATAREMAVALGDCCPSCGPERLSDFLHAVSPQAGAGEGLSPEPTEVADKPITPAEPVRSRWKLTVALLFVLAWGAGFGWWLFHREPSSPPPPPASKLPRAPGHLTVRHLEPEPAETPEKPETPAKPETVPHKPRPETAIKHPVTKPEPNPEPDPAPPPLLVARLDGDVAATLNHRSVAGTGFRIFEMRPQLIRIKPRTAKRPEVIIRLVPPTAGNPAWSIAVRSNPWMQIVLNGRPAGQTPRSGLEINPGKTKMVLRRDRFSFRLDLEVAPLE
jgi:serine/threonine protein kinase